MARVAAENAKSSALQNPFQRQPADTRAGNAGSDRPRLARPAILTRLRASRKAIGAAIALFNPYSAGLERAKNAVFAALAVDAGRKLTRQGVRTGNRRK